MTHAQAESPRPSLRAFAPSRETKEDRAKAQRREKKGNAFLAVLQAQVRASLPIMSLGTPSSPLPFLFTQNLSRGCAQGERTLNFLNFQRRERAA